ncbi:NAD(P)-binding protein [Gyrodon lividus]|nr:NAD(P)-binding protein [Gyrodon lividus]
MSSIRPLFVVAGIGNGTGTGAASARLFGKLGYRVALISRGPEHLNKVANEINQNGGEAAPFPVSDYTPNSIRSAFSSVRSRFPASTSPLRVAVFNAGYGIWKPFLEITDEEIRESLDTHVVASFAFSREVLLEFTKNDPEIASEGGKGGSRKKGTLIFTGATAAIRGNTTTSAFAAGKFGIRALSQSLAKEFGKQNIHVAHSIIDGTIITDRNRGRRNDPAWETNGDVRLDPDSIAKSYLHLVEQDSAAWTWEIDLRPAHEKW